MTQTPPAPRVGAVMTDDLVTFLRARLDETERIALDAPRGPWTMDDAGSVVDADGRRVILAVGGALDGRVSRWPEQPVVDHIARHDPARVLADVEAKRAVVRDYEDALRTLAAAGPDGAVHDLMTGATNTLKRTLRLLAVPYAAHPEFRAEWRP